MAEPDWKRLLIKVLDAVGHAEGVWFDWHWEEAGVSRDEAVAVNDALAEADHPHRVLLSYWHGRPSDGPGA